MPPKNKQFYSLKIPPITKTVKGETNEYRKANETNIPNDTLDTFRP